MNMKNVIALILAIVIACATFGIAAANAETSTYIETIGNNYGFYFDHAEQVCEKNTYDQDMVIIIWQSMAIMSIEAGSRVKDVYTFTNAVEYAKVINALAMYTYGSLVGVMTDGEIADEDIFDLVNVADQLAFSEELTEIILTIGYGVCASAM